MKPPTTTRGQSVAKLDNRFGTLVDAQPRPSGIAIDDWERAHRPASFTILTDQTARQLRTFMDDIRSGFSAGRVFVDDTIVIWVVDAAGSIRFAVEEMVYDGAATGLPKLQTFTLTKFLPKLGHPSLLNDDPGRPGRIGGEIRLQEFSAGPYWIINRRSGRYGYYADRIYVHLKNVADQFRRFDIELKIESDF